MDSIEVTPLILTCAVRYALGRMTYVPLAVVEEVEKNWPSLPEGSRKTIIQDVEDALRRDSYYRTGKVKYGSIGQHCDRQIWERCARLWRN